MLTWFNRLMGQKPLFEPPRRYLGAYKAFTTAHDRQIIFNECPDLLSQVEITGLYTPPSFDTYLEACIPHYEASAAHLLEALRTAPAEDVSVTLLLDHSGSLRGETSCRLAALTGVFSECLARLNVRHEVLAFTTSSWRGGRSKRDWIAKGAPVQPGRLCDLLHIIYRSFDDEGAIAYDALEQMTNPWLLKENIDGEALEWAAARIRAAPQRRRILIVISDGAPVDDATLIANGPNILEDHIRQVTSAIVDAGDIELYALGLGYGMGRYYPQYAIVTSDDDIGAVALPLLQAILTSAAHAPSRAQATLPP